ncbi:MAG TPA: RNA-binding S4 domain-containing protein [Bacteroidia bacterium]|nr:RNA-binding S4 domain-containing protein [Bacteroidia bacterium]HNP99298.1 RNA-binding S4 domain-containing protein [Bacteroidia bacterium]
METPSVVRIDKWLWAVRQYKTRSLATTACEQGKIIIQGQSVKPSRHIKVGDEIILKRTGLIRTLKVLQLTNNRLNAKLVPEYMQDLTPPEDIAAFLSRSKRVTIFRDPGTGRPTKRERRDLDEFMGDF